MEEETVVTRLWRKREKMKRREGCKGETTDQGREESQSSAGALDKQLLNANTGHRNLNLNWNSITQTWVNCNAWEGRQSRSNNIIQQGHVFNLNCSFRSIMVIVCTQLFVCDVFQTRRKVGDFQEACERAFEMQVHVPTIVFRTFSSPVIPFCLL